MIELRSYILEKLNPDQAVIFPALKFAVSKVSRKLQNGMDFDINDKNVELIIDAINMDSITKNGGLSVTVQSASDYYDDNGDCASKSECALKKGDIIITVSDKNDTQTEYYFSLTVGKEDLGAVSMGSLTSFDPDGYYILVDASTGEVKIVRHEDVVELADHNKHVIKPKTNDDKGCEVTFNGDKYNSEDFIGGMSLSELKSL